MKTRAVIFLLLWQAGNLFAQTGPSASNPVVANILKGAYLPSSYPASIVITDPNVISTGLLNDISVDSLKATLFKLRSFQNRNTFSDTSSTTRGIGAARRWVFSKFKQYSAAADNRLQVSYLQFAYNSCSSPIKKHSNIMAVLPGSQTTNKAIIVVEGHIDSRNDDNCDVTGNAFGIGDNATGTALVLELARVMSKYTFRNTILFSVNTGEEQGKIGAVALAGYLDSMNVPIKAVNNNDVSGGIFCGYTASGPGCPGYGALDSTDLRIFSLGSFNSPHKQWARYVKLEYKEQLSSLVTVPMNIQVMQNEDRAGRGGDHQPFSAINYTAVRLTQAYEDGDGGSVTPYLDRQHSIRDSLGRDKNGDGIEDSLYINLNYLARNVLINGNSMAMVGLGPDTITVQSAIITANRFRVQFTPVGAPAYRVAVRSATNDWDTVYTITGKTVDTVRVPYGTSTIFYLSAAAVDANNTESQFSTEYKLSTDLVPLYLAPDSTKPPVPDPGYYGIQLMPNKPNPFDESTLITIQSGTNLFVDRTWLNINSINGRLISRVKVPLKKGSNEVLFNHGFLMPAGVYICSLIIDGLPVQSTKMVFRPM
ncbi:MAG: M28 family peptidase [Chitinophagaceae bacterium]|nr:M28 family peptidase [Chitinophagaceae bacterium]